MPISFNLLSPALKESMGLMEEDSIIPKMSTEDYKSSETFKKLQTENPIPSNEELGKMEFLKINELREVYKGEKEVQSRLAPYEHRAFTREIISREGGPVTKTIGLTAAIPAYYLVKKGGLDVRTTKEAATPADIEQVKQAYIGIGEGLLKILRNEK